MLFHTLKIGNIRFYSNAATFQRGLAMAADSQRRGIIDKDDDLNRIVLESQADYLSRARPEGEA